MNYKIIPMENYARKKQFDFFKNLQIPYGGMTVEVDITEWMHKIKMKGYPFYFSFLHAVTSAANQIKEFRQRIVGEDIIEYDYCSTAYTVALENETYCHCFLDTNMDLTEFLPYAAKQQKLAKENNTLYNSEIDLNNLFFLTSIPWVSYTSIIHPLPVPADSNPRIAWGKYHQVGERLLIPVSILCNHCLVDGLHLSKFYKNIEENLKLV